MGKTRDTYWDSLKFVLIFLVVLGHMIEPYITSSKVILAVYNFIYLFHMPLFVFASGRFSVMKERTVYRNGIVRLLETVLLAQIVWVPMVLGLKVETLSAKLILSPYWMYWYLLSLALWRMLIYLLPGRLLERPELMLTASVAVSLVGGFVPVGHEFSLQRTLALLPFFMAGYYSNRTDFRNVLRRIPAPLPVVILPTVFLLLLHFGDEVPTYMLYYSGCYWDSTPLYRLIVRLALLPSAAILGTLVMRMTPDFNVLAKWGSRTMVVYMYHGFVVLAVTLLAERSYIPTTFWPLIAYTVATMAITLLFARLPISTKALNPISAIVDCYQRRKEPPKEELREP